MRGFFYAGGCARCFDGKPEQFGLCARCLDALPFYGERIWEHDAFPIYALFRENELSSKMIRGLKYRGERHWAEVLGAVAADFLLRLNLHRLDFVTAVATSRAKRRIRGYNPPELVAKKVASELALPEGEKLKLARRIDDQIGLSARERRRNVEGAFKADPLRGRVLLIDDTYTTGATMEASFAALKAAGAEEVIGLVCMKAGEVPLD